MIAPRVPLLVNPAAGGGRAAALASLFATLPGVRVCLATSADDFVLRIREAVGEGLKRLLVCGGDGSLHLAIQSLAGSDCALGIVPAGRGNDLARSLAVPLDPRAAAERALGTAPRRIDLGCLAGRFFACVAGVGFDGEVARFVREQARGPRGRLIYPYAVVRTLLSFSPPHFRIEHDGGIEEGPGMLAALANAPYYGGGMRIAPRAEIDDGRLDLVFVRSVSRLRLLFVFPRVYRGAHTTDPAVFTRRTTRAKIRLDRALTFFGDGEPLAPGGSGTTEIAIRPGVLWVAA